MRLLFPQNFYSCRLAYSNALTLNNAALIIDEDLFIGEETEKAQCLIVLMHEVTHRKRLAGIKKGAQMSYDNSLRRLILELVGKENL